MGPETWLGFFVPDPWRTGDGGGVDVASYTYLTGNSLKRIFLASHAAIARRRHKQSRGAAMTLAASIT